MVPPPVAPRKPSDSKGAKVMVVVVVPTTSAPDQATVIGVAEALPRPKASSAAARQSLLSRLASPSDVPSRRPQAHDPGALLARALGTLGSPNTELGAPPVHGAQPACGEPRPYSSFSATNPSTIARATTLVTSVSRCSTKP